MHRLCCCVSLSEAIFLFLAALVAGALNSVAGGGSFISFPALIFVRIPPIPANATNTAAMWPGTIASTIAYWRDLDANVRRMLPPLLITGLAGGMLGAFVLLHTPPRTFMKLVPWLLLGATLLFVVSGRITAWIRSGPGHKHVSRMIFVGGLLLELFIATYIGYFGAGAGVLMLALLALLGVENIHAMNGMKTLLVSVVNAVALAMFIVARVIVWPEAILMLIAAAIGGYGGAYFARKINPLYIRRLVIVVGFAMSAWFFFWH
jgi:uncharacterized protein